MTVKYKIILFDTAVYLDSLFTRSDFLLLTKLIVFTSCIFINILIFDIKVPNHFIRHRRRFGISFHSVRFPFDRPSPRALRGLFQRRSALRPPPRRTGTFGFAGRGVPSADLPTGPRSVAGVSRCPSVNRRAQPSEREFIRHSPWTRCPENPPFGALWNPPVKKT